MRRERREPAIPPSSPPARLWETGRAGSWGSVTAAPGAPLPRTAAIHGVAELYSAPLVPPASRATQSRPPRSSPTLSLAAGAGQTTTVLSGLRAGRAVAQVGEQLTTVQWRLAGAVERTRRPWWLCCCVHQSCYRPHWGRTHESNSSSLYCTAAPVKVMQ